MKKIWVTCSIAFLALSLTIFLESRSIRRPVDSSIPTISVTPSDRQIADTWHPHKKNKSKAAQKKHVLTSPYLRLNPIKHVMSTFTSPFFKDHYLPQDQHLSFRNNLGSVDTKILEDLAQQLVEEIKDRKRVFSHFTILKSLDFNWKTLSGLIVLKYKNYPFVIKLSIEHAHTMVDPYSKGYQSKFIFVLGGNIRHLSNFTRISNLEKIKNIVIYSPYYLNNIDFPRKWYWLPNNGYNLEIIWHESPYKSEERFSIPSIYAVISDYIDIDETYPQPELNKMAMKIATDTEFLIDPHAGNTVVEKGSTRYTLIDTENFRIMTGLNRTMKSKKYLGWLLELSNNCITIYSARTKKDRIKNCFAYLEESELPIA